MIKKFLIAGVLMLAIPGVASAHTGSVKCDNTGVVFMYSSNFAHTTTVTEVVNGVSKTFTVPAHTAVTDTVDNPGGTVYAGASWKDGNASGQIPTTKLVCPVVCTPIVTEKIVYVDRPVETVREVEKVVYVDRPVDRVVTKTVVKWKTKIKYRTKIKTKIIFIEKWHPIKKHHGGGVAG